MHCLVNGCEVSPTCMARVLMNYGQPFPNSEEPKHYAIVVARDELIRRFSGVWQRNANEERADIPFHEAGDDHVLDRWQALDYPGLDSLWQQDPGLTAELLRRFEMDVLDSLLVGPENELPRYLVNSLDRVILGLQDVRFEGVAFLHPRLPPESHPQHAMLPGSSS
jgi:hypothetical protein